MLDGPGYCGRWSVQSGVKSASGPIQKSAWAIARQKASEIKEMIRRGVDPVEQRRLLGPICWPLRSATSSSARVSTCLSLSRLRSCQLENTGISGATVSTATQFPSLDRCWFTIQLQDILLVLEPIRHTKTVTADKLRRKLAEVLDYVKGHPTGPNPRLGKATSRWSFPPQQALPAKRITRHFRSKTRRGSGRRFPLEVEWSASIDVQSLTKTRPGAVRSEEFA